MVYVAVLLLGRCVLSGEVFFLTRVVLSKGGEPRAPDCARIFACLSFLARVRKDVRLPPWQEKRLAIYEQV